MRLEDSNKNRLIKATKVVASIHLWANNHLWLILIRHTQASHQEWASLISNQWEAKCQVKFKDKSLNKCSNRWCLSSSNSSNNSRCKWIQTFKWETSQEWIWVVKISSRNIIMLGCCLAKQWTWAATKTLTSLLEKEITWKEMKVVLVPAVMMVS